MILGRKLQDQIKREQAKTVSQLRFDIASLQSLLFQKTCELRCATCLDLFTPEVFATHKDCAEPLTQSELFKIKAKQTEDLDISRLKVRVSEIIYNSSRSFEITIQADLSDRCAEFTVERSP